MNGITHIRLSLLFLRKALYNRLKRLKKLIASPTLSMGLEDLLKWQNDPSKKKS